MPPTPLSLADRQLGWHLGLGDLAQQDETPCMGYANACRCPDCQDREELAMTTPALGEIRQPWELKAEAA